MLFAAAVVAVELSVQLARVTRLALSDWYTIEIGVAQMRTLSTGILLLPILMAARGMFPGYGVGVVRRFREQVQLILVFFGILAVWDYLVYHGQWSRGMLLAAAGFALVLVPLVETITREVLVRLKVWGRPVVIVGAAKTGALVARLLQRLPSLGLVPVCFLDDDPTKHGQLVEGIPVIGDLTTRDGRLRGIRAAIIAMPGIGPERLARVVRDTRFPEVIVIPDLFGIESLWVQPRDLGGVLGIGIQRHLFIRTNRVLKRFIDFVIGVPALLLSLPIVGIAALWIKAVSPGPAFFAQEREGQDGKKIRVFKLRTMYPDAQERLERYLSENPEARIEWERYFKLKDDPRILPGIGHLLRKLSLDELPQLINVLRGEMSIVGPRPFPEYHLEAMPDEFRTLRRTVRPGLTGLWQVSARSDGDLVLQETLDTYYIRNWSIWLDLYIMCRTFGAVLFGKGAY